MNAICVLARFSKVLTDSGQTWSGAPGFFLHSNGSGQVGSLQGIVKGGVSREEGKIEV